MRVAKAANSIAGTAWIDAARTVWINAAEIAWIDVAGAA
jgi:hypothetical protein